MKKLLYNKYLLQIIKFLSKNEIFIKNLQKSYYSMFSYPKTVQFHINTACNYKCEYCYVTGRDTDSITTSDWIALIDELDSLGTDIIEILGGEPFLHPDLYKILDYVSKKRFKLVIFTNGVLINAEWISKIKLLNADLIISIKYGYESDFHKEDYKKAEKVIKELIRQNIPVITFITVTKNTLPYLRSIINKSIRFGAFPLLERYVPVKDKKINSKYEINDIEWHRSLELFKKAYSKFDNLIKGVSLIRGKTCSCFGDNLTITSNGFVLPCPFVPLSLNIGNVKKTPIQEIWKKYVNERRKWLEIPESCTLCQYRYVCRGGCRAMSYFVNRNVQDRDPLCRGKIPPTYGHGAFTVVRSLKNKISTEYLIKV